MANQLRVVTPLVIGDWKGEFFKEQFISGLYKPPFTLKDVKIKGGHGMKSRLNNCNNFSSCKISVCSELVSGQTQTPIRFFFFYSEAYHK